MFNQTSDIFKVGGIFYRNFIITVVAIGLIKLNPIQLILTKAGNKCSKNKKLSEICPNSL